MKKRIEDLKGEIETRAKKYNEINDFQVKEIAAVKELIAAYNELAKILEKEEKGDGDDNN